MTLSMTGLPRLADSTRRALTLARTAAGRAGASAIAPEHVLIGLLLEPSHDAQATLVRAGVAPSRLVDLSSTLVPERHPPSPGIGAAIPYASLTKDVLLAVTAEARRDAATLALPRHLLRALLLVGDNAAAQALKTLGLSVDGLRDASA